MWEPVELLFVLFILEEGLQLSKSAERKSTVKNMQPK